MMLFNKTEIYHSGPATIIYPTRTESCIKQFLTTKGVIIQQYTVKHSDSNWSRVIQQNS